MLTEAKQRLGRDEEEGFTLIELMVVVLIIAILLAIAIPTFLGARNSANARSAQSSLRNALTAEQVNWTNAQSFSTNLASIEPALTWQTAVPTNTSASNVIYASTSDSGQVVVLQAYGKDGNCWAMQQVNDPAFPSATEGTTYNKSALSSGSCVAPTPFTSASTGPTAGSAGNNTAGTTWYTSF